MRNVYREKIANPRTGIQREMIVLFDLHEKHDGICGVDNKHKCSIKHYTCLDLDYTRETTTIDNLAKNYELVVNPTGRAKKVLEYVRSAK